MVVGAARKPKTWRSRVARRLLAVAGDSDSMAVAISKVVSGLLEGVQCPPTDLDVVGSKVNVQAFRSEDIAGSGELRRDSSGFVIIYSRFLSRPRRRFTIAHEIAHAFLSTMWVDLPTAGKELERLCDMMAAEILMPQQLLAARLKGRLSLQDIFDVHREFQVSLSAAGIRCAELRSTTAFEVEGSRVIWGTGFVKKGPIQKLGAALQSAIIDAAAGRPGECQVFLDSIAGFRPWQVQHIRLHNGRMLFLLQPVRKPEGT